MENRTCITFSVNCALPINDFKYPTPKWILSTHCSVYFALRRVRNRMVASSKDRWVHAGNKWGQFGYQ